MRKEVNLLSKNFSAKHTPSATLRFFSNVFKELRHDFFFRVQNVQGGTEIVGQLGHGNTSAYKAPRKVEGLEDVIHVSCGEDFTLCVAGQWS